MADTPIENRYPWLKVGDVRPDLPPDPTVKDFAKAYATMAMVYQAQRDRTIELLKAHDEERREVLDVLRTIRNRQTERLPMPMWAKVHSGVLIVQAVVLVWFYFSILGQQRLLEHLLAAHS